VGRRFSLETARVEALAAEMVTELRRSNTDRLVVDTATLDDVERWRRAARRAARVLGLRVHTRVHDAKVVAFFYDDTPATDADFRRTALVMSDFSRVCRRDAIDCRQWPPQWLQPFRVQSTHRTSEPSLGKTFGDRH
jgi:hypothetical protein